MTATEVMTDEADASPVTPDRASVLRADAQQNRQRILVAAREAFAAPGDASLNSIAKAAGVGPGTLYRHFASREDLILAVYSDDVRALERSATDLLANHQPLCALQLWLQQVAGYAAAKHLLTDVLLHATTSNGLTRDTFGPVVRAIATLLSACEQDKAIRPGISPDDVLLLLAFLWRIDRGPDATARTQRLLDVIIAGLEAWAPRPSADSSRWWSRRSLRLPRRLSLRVLSRRRSQQ
jgi:AcrR family transcriptional regulator